MVPTAPPLTQSSLDPLVCPVCHGPLALEEQAIACTACGLRFPIEDGLPILLAARASSPPRKL